MPIIIVYVLHHSKIVFEWEELSVNKNININNFFNNVIVNELKTVLWKKNCIAHFSYTKTSEMEKLGLKYNIWETVKQCRKYVTFKLIDNLNNKLAINTINAFELMKSTLMLNYLPEFTLIAKNSMDQLRIDLNELIRSNRSVNEEKAEYIEILNENTLQKPEIIKEFRILIKALEKLEY
ncbi:2322_t:CDS:2 [Funneliformis geosporum]|uniref:2322_t:CDS:1 n=1 Tax=Funneliformis geosporum TaxID=1117311 RepID=A0A9W4WWN4_9GLOM|nr:2322_t:CDS:2 [Funneliformis geosporum]